MLKFIILLAIVITTLIQNSVTGPVSQALRDQLCTWPLKDYCMRSNEEECGVVFSDARPPFGACTGGYLNDGICGGKTVINGTTQYYPCEQGHTCRWFADCEDELSPCRRPLQKCLDDAVFTTMLEVNTNSVTDDPLRHSLCTVHIEHNCLVQREERCEVIYSYSHPPFGACTLGPRFSDKCDFYNLYNNGSEYFPNCTEGQTCRWFTECKDEPSTCTPRPKCVDDAVVTTTPEVNFDDSLRHRLCTADMEHDCDIQRLDKCDVIYSYSHPPFGACTPGPINDKCNVYNNESEYFPNCKEGQTCLWFTECENDPATCEPTPKCLDDTEDDADECDIKTQTGCAEDRSCHILHRRCHNTPCATVTRCLRKQIATCPHGCPGDRVCRSHAYQYNKSGYIVYPQCSEE